MIDKRAVQDFYTNQPLREAVRSYIEECFRQEAVDKVFKREDVSHIADAKELLDTAFTQMEAEFRSNKIINQINEAR